MVVEGTKKLVWAKVKPYAIIPTKDEENMGRDIYACFDEDYMVIPAHTTKLIPTGVACAMDKGYGIRLRDRGSNGSKGIHVNCGSVDSSFRGEIFVAWSNGNDVDVILSKLEYDCLINQYGTTGKWFGSKFIPLDCTKGMNTDNLTDSDSDNNRLFISGDPEYLPIIYPYTKAIAQAEVVIVPVMEDEEISYDELLKIPSKRGTGALGSSGK